MSNQDEPANPKKAEGLLKTAARAIGSVAGTVASTVGIHERTPMATSAAPAGKLPKSKKSRLPRREKKALQKGRLQLRQKAQV